jgi:hypothetical protein
MEWYKDPLISTHVTGEQFLDGHRPSREAYWAELKAIAQKCQADAWKLSKSDVLFLKAIKIKAD